MIHLIALKFSVNVPWEEHCYSFWSASKSSLGIRQRRHSSPSSGKSQNRRALGSCWPWENSEKGQEKQTIRSRQTIDRVNFGWRDPLFTSHFSLKFPSFMFTKTGHRPPPSQEYEQSTTQTCKYFPPLDCSNQVALLESSFHCHNPTEAGEKYGKECHGWVVMLIYFQYICMHNQNTKYYINAHI